MPFEATNWTSAWMWETPPNGQLVPDHPPIDLMPYLADIQAERDSSADGTTTSNEEQP